MSPLFGKSKEEKAMEARLAIRKGIRDLEKCDRSLEKKKDGIIKMAQEAKTQGIMQQYQMAVKGLKMIMAYQKRCKTMVMQLRMTETMRDLATLSSQFVKLMGNVGAEVTSVAKSTNYAGNQLAFEKGILSAETAMEQLEGFLEDSGMEFGSDGEDEMDAAIEQMIDATGAAAVDALDSDIEKRLAESEKRHSTLKE